MNRLAAIPFALLLVASIFPQSPTNWETKRYISLMDGNQLYADCQEWKNNAEILSDHTIRFTTVDLNQIRMLSTCEGYIKGVIDSIPIDEDAHIDPSVRFTQYFDVVFDYLEKHPESRHLPAYSLVRWALDASFPEIGK